MNKNLWKIYSVKIDKGIIISISAYIDDAFKYIGLKGFNPPKTAYKIGEFNGEEAIYRILKDIDFNNSFDLKINLNDYEIFKLLSNYMADNARITIDGNLFMNPSSKLENIKKVTLDENEDIDIIKINSGEDSGIVDIKYIEYVFMYAVWGRKIYEKDLKDNLKRCYIVESHDGRIYNYYSKYEDSVNKVFRKVINTSGMTLLGVFLVNMNEKLLKFTVLEESHNITHKEILPKGTVFYISNGAIAYMQ